MANLGRKGKIFLVRFRYDGKEYKKSLKVRDLQEAEAARSQVEVTIHRLHTGQIQIPDGVNSGDFIVSGGTARKPKSIRIQSKRIDEVIADYLEAQRTYLAPSTHSLFTIHLNHWRRHLEGTTGKVITSFTHSDLEEYLRMRVAATSETTAAKERRTLMQLFRWAVTQGYLSVSPAAALPALKSEGERPPFRTLAEIAAIIDRGGISPEEELALWDCVFLSPLEITALLQLVRKRSRDERSFTLHAIAAYTGMRRGEVIRLPWSDVDLVGQLIRARSRKQSRRRRETVRTIDMHPELLTILKSWKAAHPRGQHVIAGLNNGGTVEANQANRMFWQPLRGTEWCLNSSKNWFKIGFHTYRHSFVSNLAAAGVDQRIIDEFVGHCTDDMRRRYRHLFPKCRRSAIESLRFGKEGNEQVERSDAASGE